MFYLGWLWEGELYKVDEEDLSMVTPPQHGPSKGLPEGNSKVMTMGPTVS
jgi:hypothetical protein